MSPPLSLTLFAHVCSRPDDEVDLAEAALLVAEVDGHTVDVKRYLGALDELADGARTAITAAGMGMGMGTGMDAPDTSSSREAGEHDEARLERAIQFFYEEAGFHGNESEYYDPSNSFLDHVIDRRTGIPITLAVVLMEVFRRIGIDARGVSFPGHFLVRCEAPGGHFMVDPFAGRLLTHDDVRALYARATGDSGEPPAHLFERATKHQILVRMLSNLRGIYTARADDALLRGVLERIAVLAPSDEVRRELARLGGATPFRSGGRGLN